jgi:hypothetical protein
MPQLLPSLIIRVTQRAALIKWPCLKSLCKLQQPLLYPDILVFRVILKRLYRSFLRLLTYPDIQHKFLL